MTAAFVGAAFLMGVAGGPHCSAMCGAACAGIAKMGSRSRVPGWQFQAGRLVGYCVAGAVAATAAQVLSIAASSAAVLRPAWTVFHVAVLAWGLMLLVLARQPDWAGEAGRAMWARVRPLAGARAGIFATGALWAFMPCGLLYSALLVASLSGGPAEGALAMALFAVGSGAWLAFLPRLVFRLRDAANRARKDWGTRLSGLLLVVAAVFALWIDLAHRVAEWCGI